MLIRAVVTKPLLEPVTVDEAKSHLVVTHEADDGLIGEQITAAREHCEMVTERVFIEQTWRVRLDRFWSGFLELPVPPLISIESIKYVDTLGATQTVANTVYEVDTDSEPGRVYLGYDQQWPSDIRSQPLAVTIEFKAGFGLTGALVPAPIRAAIKLIVGDLYENREGQFDMQLYSNETVDRLLAGQTIPEDE